ncbi:hypothetical protein AFLA_006410 [Aspergillus flavus NRRL3357]|nr:hypothetical protein AFLA_006410 [Aspergillus flavus NRRL3357]
MGDSISPIGAVGNEASISCRRRYLRIPPSASCPKADVRDVNLHSFQWRKMEDETRSTPLLKGAYLLVPILRTPYNKTNGSISRPATTSVWGH